MAARGMRLFCMAHADHGMLKIATRRPAPEGTQRQVTALLQLEIRVGILLAPTILLFVTPFNMPHPDI